MLYPSELRGHAGTQASLDASGHANSLLPAAIRPRLSAEHIAINVVMQSG